MPARAMRPCHHSGCRTLVNGGYCAAHEAKRRAERNADPMRRLYKSVRWRGARLIVFARDPICMMCGMWASEHCDHVVPARKVVALYGEDEFYNPERLQGLCAACHSSKTATEDSTFAGTHE